MDKAKIREELLKTVEGETEDKALEVIKKCLFSSKQVKMKIRNQLSIDRTIEKANYDEIGGTEGFYRLFLSVINILEKDGEKIFNELDYQTVLDMYDNSRFIVLLSNFSSLIEEQQTPKKK